MGQSYLSLIPLFLKVTMIAILLCVCVYGHHVPIITTFYTTYCLVTLLPIGSNFDGTYAGGSYAAVPVGAETLYACYSPTVHIISVQWMINGTDVGAPSNHLVIDPRVFSGITRVFYDLSNNTKIQCRATLNDGEIVEGMTVFDTNYLILLMQGERK